LNQIINQGVQSVLPYIFAAIRAPCGFAGFDFSLCCADQGQGQVSTPSPPQPTPPPPNPNQQCGVSNSNRYNLCINIIN